MPSPLSHDDLLFDLLQRGGSPVLDLPYTEAFERLYSEYKERTGTAPRRHDVWERVLQVSSEPAAATQPQARPLPRPVPAPVATNSTAFPPPPTIEPSETLFDRHAAVTDHLEMVARQPWFAPPTSELPDDLEARKERIKASAAESRLGTIEQNVAWLLQRFPETRDSDIALALRYWRKYEPDVIELWNPLELEILFELTRLESIGRARRFLQQMGLWRGLEDYAAKRNAIQAEIHEYLAAHKDSAPEIRLYLDETGNEQDRAYVGIGGICVVNWKQFDIHHSAIKQWRTKEAWPEPVHFLATTAERLDRAVRLLGQLERRRGGLLFLGYAVASRGRTHQDMFSLFIQLAIDTLRALDAQACLKEPRVLRVIKEADSGFDGVYLNKLQKELAESIAIEFPGRIALAGVEAVEKGGREVMLECADLIAGGMQRRAARKGVDPKDRLSAAMFSVTGFADLQDVGALFKYYPMT